MRQSTNYKLSIQLRQLTDEINSKHGLSIKKNGYNCARYLLARQIKLLKPYMEGEGDIGYASPFYILYEVACEIDSILNEVNWYNKTTGVIDCNATIECNDEGILCL